MGNNIFHKLNMPLPDVTQLNNPFYYKPDSLILAAASELQRHLPEHPSEGKMWGVLVVEWHGELGFINAFSGQISDGYRCAVGDEWCGCPPVFDYLEPDGYFKTHEAEITEINHKIDELTSAEDYIAQKQSLEELRQKAEKAISANRTTMNEAKRRRHERRAEGNISAEERAEMERESQFLKAEVHRTKVHYRELLDKAEANLFDYEKRITTLKRRRTFLSDSLQAWLFSQFVLLNANGERKPMPDIFRDYYESVSSSIVARNSVGQICPSGAGECCEPKMLQYAYIHGMHPLRIASFWWGPALGGDVREHRHFYPACSGRCKPILSWMLRGLDVAPNPLKDNVHQKLKIIYDDDHLVVVGKPSGMLSVPGKTDRESVVSILSDMWKGSCEPLVVHRLDMATSGLLVVAKDKATHKELRRQFEAREIAKEYEAVVCGEIKKTDNDAWDGVIDLPLSADIMDRPRQIVDFAGGKPAITKYKVLAIDNGETRLRLKPLTGRTHQLRVHCASPLGLGAPIKGDELYGQPADRLYLHARSLSFVHPATGRRMTFTLPTPF